MPNIKMVPEISGKNHHYIGCVDGMNVYLTKPHYDCEWYWGFGYIGNAKCHMHINGVLNKTGKNWFDAFRQEVSNPCDALASDENLWKFVETMKTLYTLRAMADVCHIGGSHYTDPVVDLKDQAMFENIVVEKMPALFEAIVDILENSKKG